jgi:3-isopropylmalate dehydrogenase
MHLKILLLPGEGIGVEVTREARRVTEAVAQKFGTRLNSLKDCSVACDSQDWIAATQDTVDKALAADATINGRGGLAEFDNASPDKRPEKGLLGLRAVLQVFANLRPVRTWPALLTLHR